MIDDPAKQQIEGYARQILQPIMPQGAILGRSWNGMLLSVFVVPNIYDALDARGLLQAFSQLANFFAFLQTHQNVGVQASRGLPQAAAAGSGPIAATETTAIADETIHAAFGTRPAARSPRRTRAKASPTRRRRRPT